jgi:hypothetical protein
MRESWTIYAICFICLLLARCVRQVAVPVRNVKPILVVQGLITTAPGPYTINLSYSGPYTNSLQATQQDSTYFIADAKVVIRDDQGDSTECMYTTQGNYLSDDPQFMGAIGRTYTLAIYLSNGQEYLSKPELIRPVAPIDSLSFVYDSTGLTNILPPPLIVTVNTHDPGNGPHYYRWAGSGYYPRKSWGLPCNPYFDPPCTNPFMCTCFALCEEANTLASQVNVFSNQLSAGKAIIIPVYYSPIYWFGDHYVEIDQYSLSLESYQFWEQYLAQTDRTGSILDPLPSPVIGNMHNAADSSDFALGLFSASDVFEEKVVLVPLFLQTFNLQNELESIGEQYSLHGDCQLTYPNALPDETAPAGWDSAQVIKIY